MRRRRKSKQTNKQKQPRVHSVGGGRSSFPHLLRCNLDEFLHQLHALAQLAAEQDFCGHPELQLIAPLQQQAEVHRVRPASLPAECEVDQLLLEENRYTPGLHVGHGQGLRANNQIPMATPTPPVPQQMIARHPSPSTKGCHFLPYWGLFQ